MGRKRIVGSLGMLPLVATWALVGIPACGGGGAPGGTGAHGTPPGSVNGVGPLPWGQAATGTVNVAGGTSVTPGGQGQDGGKLHVLSVGDLSLDPGASAGGSAPAVPAGAMALGSDALSADVSVSGTVRIDGMVAAGGSDAVRQITVHGGDLFVTGELRAADLGGARQSLTLQAPDGAVYVTGSVDASGASGSGQAGGAITITGQQVLVSGKVIATGGDGTVAGGAAGAVTITATDAVTSSGTIELRGGVATSTAGDAMGGNGATLTIDTGGAVIIGGTVDARGGMASGAGGTIAGGAAGNFLLGEKKAPASVAILVPMAATGGDGDAHGGKGGLATLEPGSGTLNVSGAHAIDVSGGNSMTAPGIGGLVNGGPRGDPGSGGVHVAGEIRANGGSIMTGGSGNGADGGRIDFELTPTDGAFTVDASGKVAADGGRSAGAGVAGGGGHVWVFTKDGDLTIAGTASARGGDAPDPGGTGGLGGMIYCFSDNNHNAIDNDKGNLLIAPTGVLDSSGGDGATGGNARSDGVSGDWPTFPDNEEQIAIFLNCDGAHGETHNWMDNQGHLIARGGAHNGNGGDIVYHGIGPGQLAMPLDPGQSQHHPPSGNVDMAGDGSGQKGDYGGE